MDKDTKLKLKVVLIIFTILVIIGTPLLFYVYLLNLRDSVITENMIPESQMIYKDSKIARLKKVERFLPTDIRTKYLLMSEYCNHQKYDLAINTINRLNHSKNLKFTMYKGMIYEKLGIRDSAFHYYSKAFNLLDSMKKESGAHFLWEMYLSFLLNKQNEAKLSWQSYTKSNNYNPALYFLYPSDGFNRTSFIDDQLGIHQIININQTITQPNNGL
ncbi:hypothetical protein [Carboxylicivirga sp. M1479]|uniref:hypothetical protein n=1 Tax=Carboxylicivirga sp. M1479 TaxID=2594476 RepID=UPI00117879CB|nr:hypothetical protein [Carboxylicivirga sp. M1479]TRX61665.1 hypothetical protein FNN09_20125 [Carboxylicivirga sp. M1479]